MNKEEYKFDHFKNIDEVMHYLNYWHKEEDVYSIDRYLSLKDFNYISNKYQELQQQNKKQKEVIDKIKKEVDKIFVEGQTINRCLLLSIYENIWQTLKEVK